MYLDQHGMPNFFLFFYIFLLETKSKRKNIDNCRGMRETRRRLAMAEAFVVSPV
jgi:hypothetical protein